MAYSAMLFTREMLKNIGENSPISGFQFRRFHSRHHQLSAPPHFGAVPPPPFFSASFCRSFSRSSGLIVSIFSPFFKPSADGTLMMSLVNGAPLFPTGAGGVGGGAGAACTDSNSTSNTSVVLGG